LTDKEYRENQKAPSYSTRNREATIFVRGRSLTTVAHGRLSGQDQELSNPDRRDLASNTINAREARIAAIVVESGNSGYRETRFRGGLIRTLRMDSQLTSGYRFPYFSTILEPPRLMAFWDDDEQMPGKAYSSSKARPDLGQRILDIIQNMLSREIYGVNDGVAAYDRR
jgi:hypothetical protein